MVESLVHQDRDRSFRFFNGVFVAVSRQARRAIAALELLGRLATIIFYQLKGENIMTINIKTVSSGLAAIVLTASVHTVLASGGNKPAQNYCMDVEIEPFHMMPDPNMEDGSCTVPQFWDGELQEAFYPFTKEEHLFNCEYFGPETPLQLGKENPVTVPVPSAVVSQDLIVGTIGGHPFEASLACASLTNWYQDSCTNPDDPSTCSFKLAQPFIGQDPALPYPRITEVSIFDGKITISGAKKKREIPIAIATRAAGITHLEDLSTMPPEVGASVTHSLLGMVTYEADEDDKGDRDYKVLDGSVDLLLQGHIFSPVPVEEDPGAAVVRGSICSKDLYKQLNRKGGHGQRD